MSFRRTLLALTLILALSLLSEGRYLRFNIGFAMSNNTGQNDTIVMNAFTRSRYGFMFVGISKSNTSLENGLVILSFIDQKTGVQSYSRHAGANTSSIQQPLHPNTDGLWINCTDINEYPIGKYVNGMFLRCFFNSTLFVTNFGHNAWVHAAFTYSALPLNHSVIPWPLPPTPIPSWEVQVFPYSLEDDGDIGLRDTSPRWETFHLSMWIISLVFYLLVAILCLVFSQQQPLKSRGVTPLFACIGQFFHLAFEFPPFALTVHDLQFQCLYLFVFQRPIVIVIVEISIIHFFRYVVMINMNQRKAKFLNKRNDKDSVQSVGWFIKFIKVIGHPFFTLILILFTMVLLAGIFLIPWSVDAYCTPVAENINRYLYGVTLGVMFFVSLFLIVAFDLWVNFGRIKKCQFLTFWKEDIFYLRFEIYIFGIGLTFTYFIIYTILAQFKFSTLATGFIVSLSFHFLFFFQTGFPLILTIIQTIQRCVCREKKSQVLERILDSAKGRELFKEYLEMEYAVENYTCWEDMTKYKNEGDTIKRQELAQYCFKIYFNGKSSPLEVNCPGSVCKAIHEKMHEAPRNLFEDAMKTIMMNLSDTFMRLRHTPEFARLNAKEKWMEEKTKESTKVEPVEAIEPIQ